jgi:hypothetical protein
MSTWVGGGLLISCLLNITRSPIPFVHAFICIMPYVPSSLHSPAEMTAAEQATRTDIVFLGAFRPPSSRDLMVYNGDAVYNFVKRILPIVRKVRWSEAVTSSSVCLYYACV